MRSVFQLAAVAILAVSMLSCDKQGQDNSLYFSGVSNISELNKPYLTSGEKAYCVGSQDGTFPDMGSHIKNEMGGLWANPIKLADGFSLRIGKDGNEAILLDKADKYTTFPEKNSFTYSEAIEGLSIERTQFIPNGKSGIVVSYNIHNDSGKEQDLSLLFSIRFDLRPSWFSKGIEDGEDEISADKTAGQLVSKDKINGWAAVCEASSWDDIYLDDREELRTKGLGRTGTISSSLNIKPGATASIKYYISGSPEGAEEAKAINTDIATNSDRYLNEKIELFNDILDRNSISIPDKSIQEAYNYAKINTQWLVSDYGDMRFLCAGAIEYPWLFGCDNSYAQQGVVSIGDLNLAKQTLSALKEVSEKTNGNGRIIHEMSPSGGIFNRGNTQETAHFIVAVLDVFRWTGDLDWLRSIYPYMEKGLSWLFEEKDQNKDMFPEGYGIMEIHGLNTELIDVAVYSQQALEAMSQMAAILGEDGKAEVWRNSAETLKDKINSDFWDESRGLYCDFYGKSEDAARVTRDASKAFPDYKDHFLALAGEFDKLPENSMKGFLTNANWVISTPFETGIAPVERAASSLDKMRKENCGEFGPYLSAPIDKRMMTIATGTQAVAEARYGRIDQAVEYLDMIAATLHRTLPGSMCEMMPDSGCPVQAWTVYGLGKTLTGFVFGICPDANDKTVTINPNLPTGWENIAIRNVQVGDMSFSLHLIRKEGRLSATITTDRTDWTFNVTLPGSETVTLAGKRKYVLR